MSEYPFFTHRECEWFPCHEGIDPNDFNCLFCFCPLYLLGPDCGGDFYYAENGTKCCEHCTRMHVRDVGTTIVQKMLFEKDEKEESVEQDPQDE